jgi:predicted O-methyltransferase YrrM
LLEGQKTGAGGHLSFGPFFVYRRTRQERAGERGSMQFRDPRVAEVFAEYDARHRDELARARDLPRASFGARRDEFLLPVGTEVGTFLHALVIGRAAQTVLELGTSYGYSTLFLADAAKQCGARVVSIDVDASKQAYAARMLERAGLREQVEFRCGDAAELLAGDRGPWDVVLLDIWKDKYVACFEAFYPALAEEAIVVSDNMIYPEAAREAVRAYRAAVKAKADLQTALLPLGSGIEMSVKWSVGNAKL